MAVCMLLCMLPAGATAMEQGDAIEITVTNADERAYLEGIAPEKKNR